MTQTGNYINPRLERLKLLQERHLEKVEFYNSLSDEDKQGELGQLTLEELDRIRMDLYRLSHDLGFKAKADLTKDEKRAVWTGFLGCAVVVLAIAGLIIGIVMSLR